MDRCNVCGKKLSIYDEACGFIFDKRIGYGSKHDGDRVRIQLCCKCFDEVLDGLDFAVDPYVHE